MAAPATSMQYGHAIVGGIPDSLATAALRMEATEVDVAIARREHALYRSCLETDLGLVIHDIPADETLPDIVFVEDALVVACGKWLLTRPGAESRRGEVEAMRAMVASVSGAGAVGQIHAPGTLDGGDVLFTGTEFFVGISSRTNQSGIDQLAAFFNLPTTAVPVAAGLHLKSVCSMVAPGVVAATSGDPTSSNLVERMTPSQAGVTYEIVKLQSGAAANLLRIGAALVTRPPEEFPQDHAYLAKLVAERGAELGISKHFVLPNTQLAKVDGALTCCSVLF